MKTILTRLSPAQAEKELSVLPFIAAALIVIPFFTLGFLSIVGLAVSARGLLITFHSTLVEKPNINLYRLYFGACLAAAIALVVLYFANLG